MLMSYTQVEPKKLLAFLQVPISIIKRKISSTQKEPRSKKSNFLLAIFVLIDENSFNVYQVMARSLTTFIKMLSKYLVYDIGKT